MTKLNIKLEKMVHLFCQIYTHKIDNLDFSVTMIVLVQLETIGTNIYSIVGK